MAHLPNPSAGERNVREKKSLTDKLKIIFHNRPDIKIVLDGLDGLEGRIITYSTLDKIQGKVLITCPAETRVDSLSINLLGIARTFVESLTPNPATPNVIEAKHPFLNLPQPIPISSWPTGNLLEANRTYEFRFTFVVPTRLLPQSCKHPVDGSLVRQEHHCLPPSFGDKSMSGCGNTLLDDFAPKMTRITYELTATLLREGREPITETKSVRVVPATEEKPPLAVDEPNSDWKLRAEKVIRKGWKKARLGTLVVGAAQPRPIRIPSFKSEQDAPDSTAFTVNLRFEAASIDALPPKLGSMTTKFIIWSHYSTEPRTRIPSRHDSMLGQLRGAYSEKIPLSCRPVSNVEWTWHKGDSRAASPERRASTGSNSTSVAANMPEPSARYKGQGYYTAEILVPISLPGNKAWVPTFHNCIMSRMYSIDIHLAVTSGTLGDVGLRVPVQISNQGNPYAVAEEHVGLTLEEQAIEAREADEFFMPRIFRGPRPSDRAAGGSIEARGSSLSSRENDLPPQYHALPWTGPRIPVTV